MPSEESLFTMDSIEHIQLPSISSQRIMMEDLFLARPSSLAYHDNDFLLVGDRGMATQLVVIDLKQNSVYRDINKGRSSNELLALWDILVQDDGLFLSSLLENKLIKMDYDSDNRRFVYSDLMYFPQQFMHCTPIDGGYLTFGSASSGNRFVRWTENLTVIDTVGTFPVEGITGHEEAENGVLQSEFAVSPDKKKIAVAYKNIDYIEIYEDGILTNRIRGPRKYEVSIRTDEVGDGAYRTSVLPLNLAYKSIKATRRGFYAGYIGLKPINGMIPTPDMNRIRKIFHFDWEGNLIRVYTFENPVEDFAIDERSGLIYCLNNDPEPNIVKYNM